MRIPHPSSRLFYLGSLLYLISPLWWAVEFSDECINTRILRYPFLCYPSALLNHSFFFPWRHSMKIVWIVCNTWQMTNSSKAWWASWEALPSGKLIQTFGNSLIPDFLRCFPYTAPKPWCRSVGETWPSLKGRSIIPLPQAGSPSATLAPPSAGFRNVTQPRLVRPGGCRRTVFSLFRRVPEAPAAVERPCRKVIVVC